MKFPMITFFPNEFPYPNPPLDNPSAVHTIDLNTLVVLVRLVIEHETQHPTQ